MESHALNFKWGKYNCD